MNNPSVQRKNVSREIQNGMRYESARRCIGPITKGCDIFGVTKDDFSMVEILKHCVEQIGTCKVDIAAWTAGGADIRKAEALFKISGIQEIRFLIDRSFPNRQPDYFKMMLDVFGSNCVRLARCHAKFILLENDDYSIAVRTSMNFNKNKRIENYDISEGSEISTYLKDVIDFHFKTIPPDSYKSFKNLKLSDHTTKDEWDFDFDETF